MERIMLLEDDPGLIDGLSYALKKQGWEVTVTSTLAEAAEAWRGNVFDLLILDVSLPDGSGFDFCRSVRRVSDVPILFLTAADEETSVVMGLDIGGDDYVTKPFKLGILISRVNALLRRGRSRAEANAVLESNGITVALAQGQAYKNDQSLELTGAEYRLLCYFMQNPNRILTKELIYEQLWDGCGHFVDDNTLSVYIRRLRLKVEDDPEHPQKIVTARGLGYKWSVNI
jgi:DNA-binding response OmpR family regulator